MSAVGTVVPLVEISTRPLVCWLLDVLETYRVCLKDGSA